MFKINKLTMYSTKGESFAYKFNAGVTYFNGTNDTGKTQFYIFIDFMFGLKEDLSQQEWYRNTLEYAILEFAYDDKIYETMRTLDGNKCYIKFIDEKEVEYIDVNSYREKINLIFSKDQLDIKKLTDFTEEMLTYRSFMLFNFLGEKGLGKIVDFFDKSKEPKYATKLLIMLDYIFNDNVSDISNLKDRLSQLEEDLKSREHSTLTYSFVKEKINLALAKLNIQKQYNGTNKSEIISDLNKVKSMSDTNDNNTKDMNIADLEAIYNSLDEQIKIYSKNIKDFKNFNKENKKREKLIKVLNELIQNNPEYDELSEPIKETLSSLDKSISFSSYLISTDTLDKIKKEREKTKKKILYNSIQHTRFNNDEKTKAVALIEEYLAMNCIDSTQKIDEIKKEIKETKKEIRKLQNETNTNKIKKLSSHIDKLYKSAQNVSQFVNDDISKNEFGIEYIKKGNILQPYICEQYTDDDGNRKKRKLPHAIGSMARHTLIQFCGYLAFIKMLVEEDRYPVIPMLVIDHMSKPFDEHEKKSIGMIIKEFYSTVSKNDIQIIMFSDSSSSDLGLELENEHLLKNSIKSGFNPFYISDKIIDN